MSEIHANIIVEPLDLTVSVEQPEITIAPEALNLNMYLGGIGVPGGNVNTIQYNNGGVLGGLNSVFWTGSKLSLGDTNNITISGGSANYALITDGTGNLSWGSTANANYANFAGNAYAVSGANVSGTVANANYAAYAGNVTIAAQPNITSLGTLANLIVDGTANLSSVGNVKITGGTNGQYLQTDGAGNLSWVSGGGSGNGVVGGSNTQIQFNDGGSFGATANLTFNKSTNLLTVTGTANITGNANVGNLGTAGLITATGNVTGGNFVTAGGLTATGNVVAGNVYNTPIADLPYGTETITIVTTAPNTYSLDLLTSSTVLCTANATANTILNIRGNVSVTANSLISVGQSVTSTILIKTGTTPYKVTTLQIDGSNRTINWVNGSVPPALSNSLVAYTFTAIKTATTPNYTVLGSATRYA